MNLFLNRNFWAQNLGLVALIIFLIGMSGCSSINQTKQIDPRQTAYTSTSVPSITYTPIFVTPSSTITTPSPIPYTNTIIPYTATPIPDTATPTAVPIKPITIDNASQLTTKMRIGKGDPSDVAWTPDGKIIAIGSSIGIYLFNTNTYEEKSYMIPLQQQFFNN